MDNLAEVGKYLCRVFYQKSEAPWLHEIIDKVISNAHPMEQLAWSKLLSGDLVMLNSWVRLQVWGGGASFPDDIGIDGHIGIYALEWKLYRKVGEEFSKLLVRG